MDGKVSWPVLTIEPMIKKTKQKKQNMEWMLFERTVSMLNNYNWIY